MDTNTKAWLLYVTTDPNLALVELYEDDIASTYQWDDLVANHAELEEGDTIALWDGNQGILRGISVISQIVTGEGTKKRYRCPYCNKTKVKPRKNLLPPYRCFETNCKHTFQTPKIETLKVKTYRTNHSAGWIDLSQLGIDDTFKKVSVSPKSQQSLRPLRPEAFQDFLKNNSLVRDFHFLGKVRESIRGGHKWIAAKTRIGQGAFRKELLNKYGTSCAISGPAPEKAIHACHLYSYSKLAKHEEEGGLLLRSDLHSLFDAGLIRINPKSEETILDPSLKEFPKYWSLNRNRLTVSLTPQQKRWLELHWNQHAPLNTTAS